MSNAIKFRIEDYHMSITIHTRGNKPEGTIVTPSKDGHQFNQFLALEWGGSNHDKGVSKQVSVYLERGDVEALRDELTQHLAQMGDPQTD